jgi:monofunctional biosynthetic peptidoglycan transglycosylase
MVLFRIAFGLARLATKLVLLLLFFAGITLVVYTVFWLPDVSRLRDNNPETTAFIEQARARVRAGEADLQIRQTWVPLDRISNSLVEALLIGEDDRFYQHQGFDLTEIKKAVEENYQAGKWVRGGSTLSQQLVKNLYLSPDKTLKRKFDEMVLTWKLEKSLSKNRILEIYLNVVEWGGGCFGAEAASRYYYSKPASALTEAEAASLAARLPNPDGLSEERRKRREAMILARLQKRGDTPRVKEEVAAKPPAQSAPSPDPKPIPDEPQATFMIERVAKVGGEMRAKVAQFFTAVENPAGLLPSFTTPEAKAPEQVTTPAKPKPPLKETAERALAPTEVKAATPSLAHVTPPPSHKPIFFPERNAGEHEAMVRLDDGSWTTLVKKPSGETPTKPPGEGETAKSKKLRESLSRLEKALGQ